MSDDLPRISFTARDFDSIKSELLNFIKKTRQDSWTDFAQSNLGVSLIELAALVGDMLSYGMDVVGQETFLKMAKRYSSALRFAKAVGYIPRGASAAITTLKSTQALPTPIVSYGGVIPRGTTITGQNGLIYELQEDLTIDAGATVVRMTLKQGKSYSEVTAPSAQPSQTIVSGNGVVEDGSWVVFVGDPLVAANQWTQVDDVALETGATNTYSVTLDDQGRLLVTFGDGTAGAIPNQAITLDYRTCDGVAGNVPVGAIRGSVKVNVSSPGTGVVSIPMENRDDSAEVSGGTQLHTDEDQGATVSSATQSGTLANTPVLSSSAVLTFVLPSGGGTIVLSDNGAGAFTVATNTSALTLLTSSITYSTGAWQAVFSAPMAAGGVMEATYYAVVPPSADTTASVGAATGGADRESLTELKRNIPAYIRSQNRVLTRSDYSDNLERLPGVAKAFADVFVGSYTINMVKVSVWSSEVIGFRSEDSQGILGQPSDYTRYKTIAEDQVTGIQGFLRERTLLTVSNVILRPQMLWVDVYLGTVTYDKRLDETSVRNAITKAVIATFENGDGFNVRMSDIYDAVRTAKGVKYFNTERIATGEQQTSDEVQGVTSASTTVSGTLQSPTATPGSVVITVEQTSSMSAVIKDNGSGGFVVDGGTLVLASGSIDYATGAWMATFTTTLIPAQQVLASYSNVTKDYRRDQVVTLNDETDGDQWPPPGNSLTHPTVRPPYSDGVPLSAARPSALSKSVTGITRVFASGTVTATAACASHGYRVGDTVTIEGATPAGYNGDVVVTNVPDSGHFKYTFAATSDPGAVTGTITARLVHPTYPYAVGDVMTYDKLQDIVISTVNGMHLYDEEFLYNDEIYYDSVEDVQSDVRTINLRRLVFDLNPA